jgi:hypothetical protein
MSFKRVFFGGALLMWLTPACGDDGGSPKANHAAGGTANAGSSGATSAGAPANAAGGGGEAAGSAGTASGGGGTEGGEGGEGGEPPEPLGSRNFACSPSRSSMYQADEVVQMTIAADFTKVNTAATKEEAISDAMVDPDGPGPLAPVAAQVLARGISRFSECGFRPFSLKFPSKQKDNVFHHLGKTVPFSTHCGDREDMHPTLKAPSLEEYHQRVRMEHAIYRMLDVLETLSLKTRLVELTYHDTATGKEETHDAFVREPKDEMAQRCGMVEGEDIPEDASYGLNERAYVLMTFLFNFVIQADTKNHFAVVDLKGGLAADVPYDFDLVGAFRRDYGGLGGRTLADNAVAFADWLRRNNSPALQEEAQLILDRAEPMRLVYETVGLNATNLALFEEWFDRYLEVLGAFRQCEGKSGDMSSTACYVPDDFVGTAGAAEPLPLGEHSAMVEPPGDVDVVKVELTGGKLYTFCANPGNDVLGSDGQVLHQFGFDSLLFSVRPVETAGYFVGMSRGESLVCSDIWATDISQDQLHWAVFEDDHGSSEALATPLSLGATVQGKWEPDSAVGVYDEDWFTLTATGSSALSITLSGEGVGRAESMLAGGDPREPIASVDIDGFTGTSDLSTLVPAAGDYVIRIVQDFSPASYALSAK